MKEKGRVQVLVALGIVLIGGAIVGGEYLLVKWYPRHRQAVSERTLELLPYQSAGLGVEMKVAAGLYGKAEDFVGGVKITRPLLVSADPSLTITTQPNLEHTFEFSPEILAKWQTLGTYQGLLQYNFEHTKIMDRDAVLIWQSKNRAMNLTARIITPERIIEAECTPGGADEQLFLQACEATLRTIKVSGPEPPAAPAPGIQELAPLPHRRSRH